jgi:hypothetical protein
MPGYIIGNFTGATNTPTPKRPERSLNFWYAHPPERDIRDREDAPGARNPYNLWPPSDLMGGEDTGMTTMKLVTYDDDVRFAGSKPFSYSVAGQILDAGGSPAYGMTVELWMISVDWPDAHQPLLIGTTTSDDTGWYGFSVPNNVTKYAIVTYDGSRGGASSRSLTGA